MGAISFQRPRRIVEPTASSAVDEGKRKFLAVCRDQQRNSRDAVLLTATVDFEEVGVHQGSHYSVGLARDGVVEGCCRVPKQQQWQHAANRSRPNSTVEVLDDYSAAVAVVPAAAASLATAAGSFSGEAWIAFAADVAVAEHRQVCLHLARHGARGAASHAYVSGS